MIKFYQDFSKNQENQPRELLQKPKTQQLKINQLVNKSVYTASTLNNSRNKVPEQPPP